MDIPEGTTAQNPEDYLVKLREAQLILVQATQEYLKNQRKRGVDGGRKDEEITKFAVGDYVLLTNPNRPPNKYIRNVSWSSGYHGDGSSRPRKS